MRGSKPTGSASSAGFAGSSSFSFSGSGAGFRSSKLTLKVDTAFVRLSSGFPCASTSRPGAMGGGRKNSEQVADSQGEKGGEGILRKQAEKDMEGDDDCQSPAGAGREEPQYVMWGEGRGDRELNGWDTREETDDRDERRGEREIDRSAGVGKMRRSWVRGGEEEDWRTRGGRREGGWAKRRVAVPPDSSKMSGAGVIVDSFGATGGAVGGGAVGGGAAAGGGSFFSCTQGRYTSECCAAHKTSCSVKGCGESFFWGGCNAGLPVGF